MRIIPSQKGNHFYESTANIIRVGSDFSFTRNVKGHENDELATQFEHFHPHRIKPDVRHFGSCFVSCACYRVAGPVYVLKR